MFKAMVFLKRKPGLTREEFIAHYEGTHARLFQKHFPPIPDYRRNYPVWDDPLTFMGSLLVTAPSADIIMYMASQSGPYSSRRRRVSARSGVMFSGRTIDGR